MIVLMQYLLNRYEALQQRTSSRLRLCLRLLTSHLCLLCIATTHFRLLFQLLQTSAELEETAGMEFSE